MKLGRVLVALMLPWTGAAQMIHLKAREIHPDRRGPVTLESPGPRWTGGRSHLILQFPHAISDDQLQQLSARGAYVLGAVPEFGVMISVPDGFSADGLEINWAGRLAAADKLSRRFSALRSPRDVWIVAEFFADVDMLRARRLAEAAGFRVHTHSDLLPTHLLLSGRAERLSGLAQWDEVAYVFPASEALIHGEHVEHCIGALTSGGLMPMFVTASSGWPKNPGGTVTISYVFGNLTSKLDPAQATQEISRALESWGQYAPIQFVPGQSPGGNQTVYVQFLSYNHGDGYPFDGPGGVLAHTFYPAPPNPESIAGDMHLDGSEDWHIGANTDLYTVAVHEAGHALGLAHTDDPSALMYPYYRLGSKIAADDIAGVQSLYGVAEESSPPVAPITPLTLSITTPPASTTTANPAIAVTGTASGANGPLQVTWQTDHGASGSAEGAERWTIASVPLVIGGNTVTVTASDSSRKAVQAVSINRSAPAAAPIPPVNHTPPTINITWPNGTVTTTNNATIDVRGTAADSSGISKVTWQSPTASGNATGTTSWTAKTVPLLVGDNTIIVRAYDPAGNMAWRSILVIRN